jgi:Flp pilus assembly protein TadG
MLHTGLPSRRAVRARRKDRGQSLVEFALVLPLVLLLTLGIVDAARLFAADVSLTNGVREAALFAAAKGKCTLDASIQSHITDEASGMDQGQIIFDSLVCNSGKVTIAASYPFHALTPIGGLMNSTRPGHPDPAIWITVSTTAAVIPLQFRP